MSKDTNWLWKTRFRKGRIPDNDPEVENELRKFEVNDKLDDAKRLIDLVIGGYGLLLYSLFVTAVMSHAVT